MYVNRKQGTSQPTLQSQALLCWPWLCAGIYEDLSGPAILNFFAEAIQSPWEAVYKVIPDEQPLIEDTLKQLVSALALCSWT